MRRLTKYAPLAAIFFAVTALADPDVKPGATSEHLSNADVQAHAAAIQARLEEDTQHVAHLKDLAQKKQDVIKLNCVNDRIIQIKAQRNIADDTNSQLQAALSKTGDTTAPPLFEQLKGIGDNVKHLREQANSCLGETELSRQESGVEVIAPVIPDDPTIGGVIAPEVEAPGYASPYT